MKRALLKGAWCVVLGLAMIVTGCNDDESADLGGTATIQGVVNSMGTPTEVAAIVAGVSVELKDADGEVIAATVSGADGSFVFNNVPAGSYTLVFSQGGITSEVTIVVAEGETVDLEVDVDEDGTATVVITRTLAGGGEPETVVMVRHYWCADGVARWILVPASEYEANPDAYTPRKPDCVWQRGREVVQGGPILQDTSIAADGVRWFYFDAVNANGALTVGPSLMIITVAGGPDFKIDFYAAGYTGKEEPAATRDNNGQGLSETIILGSLVIGERYYIRVTEVSGLEGGVCDVVVSAGVIL